MAVIRREDAAAFSQPGLTVTGFAAPSRGAHETCLYRLVVEPGNAAPPHILDREEIFFTLSGSALATLDTEQHTIGAGDALIVPPAVAFHLSVLGQEPFKAIAVMPVGGRARLIDGDGVPFSPPWTI
ncbi:MAG: cupin domain-containing protein [Dehalococcoidia bacterium]